jgi:hypothetical protein
MNLRTDDAQGKCALSMNMFDHHWRPERVEKKAPGAEPGEEGLLAAGTPSRHFRAAWYE